MSRRWPVVRRDLIGRRFFALKCGDQSSVDIRKGVIRASTHADCSAVDAKVLVEFDDALHWKARKWVAIYSEFDVFLVEDTLVGLVEDSLPEGQYQLALEFMVLVDKSNYSNHLHHVECLLPERPVQYVPNSRILRLKEDDYVQLNGGQMSQMSEVCKKIFSSWMTFQQSQQIMISYPLRAVGHIVKVYNIGDSSQWYFARIIGLAEDTKFVTVVDDKGLEHKLHFALVQMELSSKDSASILRDVAASAKPRTRPSLEEHPVIKQPKLELSVGEDSKEAVQKTSTSLQRPQQLPAGNESQTAQVISLDSGSRNIFQSVIRGKTKLSAAPMKNTLDTRSVSSVPLRGVTIQSTKLTGIPNDWIMLSSPRNLEPTKIRNLLGYRPQPVMIVLPSPCVTDFAASSTATTSHLNVAASVFSCQNLVSGIYGRESSVSHVTVNNVSSQSSPGGQLSHVTGNTISQLDQNAGNLLANTKFTTVCRSAAPKSKGAQNVIKNNLGEETVGGVRQTAAPSRGKNFVGYSSPVSCMNPPNTKFATVKDADQLLMRKNDQSLEVKGPEGTCRQTFGTCPPLRGPLEVKLSPRTNDPQLLVRGLGHLLKLNAGGGLQSDSISGIQEVSKSNGLCQPQMPNAVDTGCNQQIPTSPQMQQQNGLQRVSEGQCPGEFRQPSGQPLVMPMAQLTGEMLTSPRMQPQGKVQKCNRVPAPGNVLQTRMPNSGTVHCGQQKAVSHRLQGSQTFNSLESGLGTAKVTMAVGAQAALAPRIIFRPRQDTGVKHHLQNLAVNEGVQQMPLITSVMSFASGDMRLARGGAQHPRYSVAGGPRMFPGASPQMNACQTTLSASKYGEVNSMQQPRCRLTSTMPADAKLKKSSNVLVNEIVENVLRRFGPPINVAPCHFQQKHENVDYLSSSQNSSKGIQSSSENSLGAAVSTTQSAISASQSAETLPRAVATAIKVEPGSDVADSMSAMNSCMSQISPGSVGSKGNQFSAPHLRIVDSRNYRATVSALLAASSGTLRQEPSKDLQKPIRHSGSQSCEAQPVHGPKAVSRPHLEAEASGHHNRQLPVQHLSEGLNQLLSDLKHSQHLDSAEAKKRLVIKTDASLTDDVKCEIPDVQFDAPAVVKTENGSEAASLSQMTLTAKRKNKRWFEEYENELKGLSRVLDMMKRLDNASSCVRFSGSSTSQTDTAQKLLERPSSNQTSKTSTADLPQHSTAHNHVIRQEKKSDCEVKMGLLLKQFLSFGLKFENPSAALSKKRLNAFNKSDGSRTYIQDKSCLELSSVLQKCRECKCSYNNPIKHSQVLCRFHAFRRLMRNSKGGIVSGGFSNPTDADAVDIALWMPMTPIVDPQIDVNMAKYIVKNVGNRFCELVEQEKDAMSWVSSNNEIAWKRAVNGVREMCDVCSTTLFNIHWVCRKCGYVACLDCYRTIMHRCSRCTDGIACTSCDRGHFEWAKCSADRQPHEPKEMMLTQIIPSDVLWVVGRIIHRIRKKWNILENCPCGEDRSINLLDNPQEQVNHVTQSDERVSSTDSRGLLSCLKPESDEELDVGGPSDKNSSDVGAIGTVGSSCDKKIKAECISSQSSPTLRDFLVEENCEFDSSNRELPPATSCKTLNDVLQRVANSKLSHLVQKAVHSKPSSISQNAAGSSVVQDPSGLGLPSTENVPHVWLDDGRLLQLLEPRHPGNLRKFQEVWQKGKPVLVSNCDRHITKDLWLPETFANEFGDMENDLVDCTHKVVLIGHKMRHFWQGFERVSARLRDSHGEPMILKLKDWPPTEDFSEVLPCRFKDLLQGLPLPEYTDRTGVFNLASRLPEYFVRPDLGPKMYNAYGSALHPMVGSTNLHLDISDAVNLILYVGIPRDDTKDHEAAAIEGMKIARCCDLTMARITEEGHKPGALWHIFDAKDSDKIRDLLTKVGLETGEPVEPHHDPIHDQSWYLDEALRERLLREYSVQGYTLVQCVGDAIFIPAGAPHQVRNFHSCIKAAEDFVSPENLSHCFQLTQEFRHLSDTHSNHEDKLQVKNIIYHAVKDAIAVLQNSEPDSV